MVILGAVAVIGLIAGIWWLARLAWGRRDRHRTGGRLFPSIPVWALPGAAALAIIAVVVLLRGRGFPLLLLLIPLALRVRREQTQPRCPSCGQPVSPQAMACFACGASIG